MRTVQLEWSNVRWYRATIDLDDPSYEGLTVVDFPVGTQDLSDRMHELLGDLETEPSTVLWQVDGVEIASARPVEGG